MREKILHLIDNFNTEKYSVYIIANVIDTVQTEDDFIKHTNFSEFFTKSEFSSIASAICEIFGYVRIFYSEIEFIHFITNNIHNIDINHTIVYNFARDGVKEGKKSLIPSFCDLYDLKYTGSNPFVISLLRNKLVYTKYLSTENIPAPITYKYRCGDKLNLALNEKKIIIKNIFESASIGMTSQNILDAHVNNREKQICSICKKMNTSEVLIQEYIYGSEYEVFVIHDNNKYIAFTPIVINIHNNDILTDEISNLYDYDFNYETNKHICKVLCNTTEKAAEKLNIGTHARFDYRVNSNGQHYLFDIAGTPYITRHSSIAYLFKTVLNLKYSDIFKLIAALTVNSNL